MSRSLDALDPTFLPYARYLVHVARDYLGRTTVTSTRRSRAEQTRLYTDWLAGRRSLMALPPGRSLHELGLAIDLVVGRYQAGGPPSAELTALGHWWRQGGGRWGGPADPVHFSL